MSEQIKVTRILDTSGKCCPMPMVETNKTLKKLAEGEVVVIDEHFGIRITQLVSPKDRVQLLQ